MFFRNFCFLRILCFFGISLFENFLKFETLESASEASEAAGIN